MKRPIGLVCPADRPATRPHARGARPRPRRGAPPGEPAPAAPSTPPSATSPRFLPPGTLLVVNRSATLPASLPAPGRHRRLHPQPLDPLRRRGSGWPSRAGAPRDPGPLPLARRRDASRRRACRRGSSRPIPACRASGSSPSTAASSRRWRSRASRSATPISRRPTRRSSAYQTIFADVPGSAEMPSAARPFTPRVLDDLARRGVAIAPIELHTGVSSLEVDADRDRRRRSIPSRSAVPAATAAAVNEARREGRPVIAVGTTVVRALESAWDGTRCGRPRASPGSSSTRAGGVAVGRRPDHRPARSAGQPPRHAPRRRRRGPGRARPTRKPRARATSGTNSATAT